MSRFADRFPLDSGSHPATAVSTSPTAYGSMSNGLNVVNMGIASQWSGTYFTESMRTAAGAANPRAIIHNIGTNDYRYYGVAPSTFKTNLKTVINDLKSKVAGPCAHILVHHYETLNTVSGLPVADWEAYGDAKRELAQEDPDNIAFIDLSPV